MTQETQTPLALLPGTLLHGAAYQYTIQRVLGSGSFGITYLATATVRIAGALGTIDTEVRVAIKEFFMRDINGRENSVVTSGSRQGLYADYRRKFIREARNLSKLQHPGIIKVIEAFEENNTVYYAMEYIDGGSLDALILRTGGLPQEQVVSYTCQIGAALSFMHAHQMLHLDLKPANIMLRQGQAVLIDFGLSKQYDSNGEPESSTGVGLGTVGYAPIEQSDYRDGKGFPVTMDIYALGATMFKMLTGHRPPSASEIFVEGFPEADFSGCSVDRRLLQVVEKAMAPSRRNRYQTVTELLEACEGMGEDEETVVDRMSVIFDNNGDENRISFLLINRTTHVSLLYYHGRVYEDTKGNFVDAFKDTMSISNMKLLFEEYFQMKGSLSFENFVTKYSDCFEQSRMFASFVSEKEYVEILFSLARKEGIYCREKEYLRQCRVVQEPMYIAFSSNLSCPDDKYIVLHYEEIYCDFSVSDGVFEILRTGKGERETYKYFSNSNIFQEITYQEDEIIVALLGGMIKLYNCIEGNLKNDLLLLATIPFNFYAGPAWGDVTPKIIEAHTTLPTKYSENFDFVGTDICKIGLGGYRKIPIDIIRAFGFAPKEIEVMVDINATLSDIYVSIKDKDSGKSINYNFANELCKFLIEEEKDGKTI